MVISHHTRFRVKDHPPRIKHLSRSYQEACRRDFIAQRRQGELRPKKAIGATESGRPKRPAEELRCAFNINWDLWWWLRKEQPEKMSGIGKHNGGGAMNGNELWGYAAMRTSIMVPSEDWVSYLTGLRTYADVKALQKHRFLEEKETKPIYDAIKNTSGSSNVRGLDLTVEMAHSLLLPEQLGMNGINRTSKLDEDGMAEIARRWAKKFSGHIELYSLSAMEGFVDEPFDEEGANDKWRTVAPEQLRTDNEEASVIAFEVKKKSGAYCYVVYHHFNDGECDIIWYIDSEITDDMDGQNGVANNMYEKLLNFRQNLTDRYSIGNFRNAVVGTKRVLMRPVSFGPFAAPKRQDGSVDAVLCTCINVMCLRALVMDEPYCYTPEKCRRIMVMLVVDMMLKPKAFPEQFRKGLFVCPPRELAKKWARKLEKMAPEYRLRYGWASQSVYEYGRIDEAQTVVDAVNVWLEGCKAESSDDESDGGGDVDASGVGANDDAEGADETKAGDRRSVIAEADEGRADESDHRSDQSSDDRKSDDEEKDTSMDRDDPDDVPPGAGRTSDEEEDDEVMPLPERSFEKPTTPGKGKGKSTGGSLPGSAADQQVKVAVKEEMDAFREEMEKKNEDQHNKTRDMIMALLGKGKKRDAPKQRSSSPEETPRKKKKKQHFLESDDSDDMKVDDEDNDDEDKSGSESSDEDSSSDDDRDKHSGKAKKGASKSSGKMVLSEAMVAAEQTATRLAQYAEECRHNYEEYFAGKSTKVQLTVFPEGDLKTDVDHYVSRFQDNKRKRGIPEGLVARDLIPDVALTRLRGRTQVEERNMTGAPNALDRSADENLDVAASWSEYCMLIDTYVPPEYRKEFFIVAKESWRDWTFEAPLRNRSAYKKGGFNGAIAYCGWCCAAYMNSQKHGTGKWEFSKKLEPHFTPVRLLPGAFVFARKGDTPEQIMEKITRIRVLLEKIELKRREHNYPQYNDAKAYTMGLWTDYYNDYKEKRPFAFGNTWKAGFGPEFLREDYKKKDDKDKDPDDDKDDDKKPLQWSVKKEGRSDATDGRKRTSGGSTDTKSGNSGQVKKRSTSPPKQKGIVNLDSDDEDKKKRQREKDELQKRVNAAFTPKRVSEPTEPLRIQSSSGEDSGSSPVLLGLPSHDEVLAVIAANRKRREDADRIAFEKKQKDLIEADLRREKEKKEKDRKKEQERHSEKKRQETQAKSGEEPRRSGSKDKSMSKDKTKEKDAPKDSGRGKSHGRSDHHSRKSETPDPKGTHKSGRSGAHSPTKRPSGSSSHHKSGDKKSRSERRNSPNLY
jgi:hypothetical protein